MNLFKKAFTLIELIVVIVVLGILAAIVIPNISSFQKEAEVTAIGSNVRNLQTSVDMYSLESLNQFPVEGEQPAEFIPKPIDFDKIHPDYTRNLPKTKATKYWIDFKGKVWASTIDSPKTVNIVNGQVTWDKVEEADYYNIYAVEGYKGVIGAAQSTQKYKFVDKVETESYSGEAGIPYVVSAVDENGFETPPSGIGYKGYDFYVSQGEAPVVGEEPQEEVVEKKEPYVAGPQALTFNGSSSQVYIANRPEYATQELTFEAWIKTPSSMGTMYRNIISKGGNPAYVDQRDFNLYAISNGSYKIDSLHLSSYAGSQNVSVAKLPVPYEPNTWHHVAVTVDIIGTVKYYSDGELIHTYNGTPININRNYPIVIGKADNAYLGSINKVSLWNTVRTEEEIKSDMNTKLDSSEENLIGNWELNESNGNIATDTSKVGNNGQISNATWTQR